MPVYEYQCTACQHEFEREQRISEAAIKKCPKCGKAKAKRLISRTSFVLKGGGWYGDLYASQKPSSESKDKTETAPAAKSDSAAAGEAKSEPAKAETKSEAKPEKKSKGKKAAA
ncbi:MAG: zinc ribbon domain-containing protein [Deltaproteobacteria bacterium]|nr:zinc ribbon domain-containing protein [Deltaproteobacteria bacterium]